MPLWKVLLFIGVVLLVLILIMFPEARALFKGFGRLFVKDMAQTPEGADAIYGEKIDQAQDSYNRADNALRLASGKLQNAQRDLKEKTSKLKKIEEQCEQLVKSGNMESAKIKVEEREDVIADIKRLKMKSIFAKLDNQLGANKAAMAKKKHDKEKKENK